MDPLVGTLVLILLALVGSRISFSTERVPDGPRLLFRTGTHFLILGFLLGPSGLGLLSDASMAGLSPFLALGLGWVGFHFGLQFDRESLAHFPWSYHVLGAGQAILTFALFLGGAYAAAFLLGVADDVSPVLLVGAAATASVTTPACIAMVSSNFMVRGDTRDLLFFIGSLDAAVGIVALQVTYSLFRPATTPGGAGELSQLALLGVAAGLGIVLGIVYVWLVRRRPATEELVLYVLGICALAAGLALQWALSPLFVSVVMGVVVANWVRDRQRVFALLQRWEKPVYLSFLMLAGALLDTPSVLLVGLALGYALLRAVAKTVGAAAMVSVVPLRFEVPRRLGLGLIPQGGISLTMAVSGVLTYTGLQVRGAAAEGALFTVIVLGVMMSELVGPFFTVQLLRRAGEITPQVEAALAKGDQRHAEREALRHTTPSRRERGESGP
ncbi:MAG TPA: cation:proton antiporter [Longimicrobiales bacterium]|nr:cation:proton antiporter [Longimicrobiales bacterium]